jgi:hypothetical protein
VQIYSRAVSGCQLVFSSVSCCLRWRGSR